MMEREVLTVHEVARLFGMSERWVYSMVALDRIPGSFRVGKRIFFSRPAIERLLGERIDVEPNRDGGAEGK